MATLNLAQLTFLQEQGIPLSRVFDATGLARETYRSIMRELELFIAFGVTPCRRAGHTLRTAPGHCAQCNTHAIAFVRRHYEDGDVYVAVSDKLKLVKVGVAREAMGRIQTLNSFGYAGAVDWRLVHSCRCSKAGEVEFRVHNDLSKHATFRSYLKAGKEVVCGELFSCKHAIAISAVSRAVGPRLVEEPKASRLKQRTRR